MFKITVTFDNFHPRKDKTVGFRLTSTQEIPNSFYAELAEHLQLKGELIFIPEEEMPEGTNRVVEVKDVNNITQEEIEDMKPKYISRLHGVLGARKAEFKEKYGIESFSDLPEDILKLCIDRIEFKDTPDDARHVSEEQLKTYITEHYENN